MKKLCWKLEKFVKNNMKKLLSIIVLGLLLGGNAYAEDDIKIGMNYYEINKVLKAKGII